MVDDVSVNNGRLMIETNTYCNPTKNTKFRIELNIFNGMYRIFEQMGRGIEIGPLVTSKSDFTEKCKRRLLEYIVQGEIVDAVMCVLMIALSNAIK